MSRFRIAAAALLALGVAVAVVPVLAKPAALSSGIEKGGALPAFNPTHVTGPDRDSNTCPVCRYPTNPAVQAWINTDDEKNVVALASALEKTARANAQQKLKVFVVFMNPNREPAEGIAGRLARIGAAAKLERVSLVYLPGPDAEAVKEYAVNTDARVRNTVFVYRNRTVSAKFVNLTADGRGVSALDAAVHKTL